MAIINFRVLSIQWQWMRFSSMYMLNLASHDIYHLLQIDSKTKEDYDQSRKLRQTVEHVIAHELREWQGGFSSSDYIYIHFQYSSLLLL